MINKDSPRDKESAPDLRRRVEELLAKNLMELEEVAPEDLRELIEDLYTREKELSRHNEVLLYSRSNLEKSRYKYFDLFDFAPVGYFALNEKGTILEANITGADLLHVQRIDLKNQLLGSYVAPNHSETFRAHLARTVQTRDRQTCELELTKSYGVTFWAHLDSIVLQNGEGDCNELRTTVTDISARVAAEQKGTIAAERLQLSIDNMLNAYALHEAIFDDTGRMVNSRFLEFNQAALKMVNLTRDEVIGHELLELYPNIAKKGLLGGMVR